MSEPTGARDASLTAWAKVAPLEDEDMLGAVQGGLSEVVIPELRRLGGDEFVISQTHSLMSIVGFTRRGLHERQKARAACLETIAALLADDTSVSSGVAGADPPGATLVTSDAGLTEGIRRAVRTRLDADIAGRTLPGARTEELPNRPN